MNLYLFELSGRTLLGYVSKKDLLEFQPLQSDEKEKMEETYFDIEDAEYVTVHSPAIVSMTVIPIPGNIQVPNKQQEMTVAPTLMPYYIGKMVLFVGNIMAVSEIPEDHFFREEMKRIVLHFKHQTDHQKKFIPKVIQ